MTRDDIIRIAREALGDWDEDVWLFLDDELERFAALVAAAEREACAELCDSHGDDYLGDLIRARGEQPKRHPGYIVGDHWLQAAYTRVCTGEDVRDVMADYGWYP